MLAEINPGSRRSFVGVSGNDGYNRRTIHSGFFMRFIFIALTALSGLLVSTAQAESLPADIADGCLQMQDLLDVRSSPEQRQVQMARLEREIQGGSWHAAYVLGNLYRLGEQHPAKLVAKDLERARTLLSQAAVHGKILAMADMAELYLEQKRAMEAMIWAQAFVHFDEKYNRKTRRDNRGYQAYLIQRSFAVFGNDAEDLQTMEAYLGAFIAKHSDTIEAILSKDEDAESGRSQSSMCHKAQAEVDRKWPLKGLPANIYSAQPRRQQRHVLSTSAMVMYWVGVDPDGSVRQAFAVDSLPDMTAAKNFQHMVKAFKFNAVAADAPIRYAYLPINYSDGSMSLRPVAD